jgi:hypothetical protein
MGARYVDDPQAMEYFRALGQYLADLACEVPRSDPSFHPRPEGLNWPYGDEYPESGQVDTPYGKMDWSTVMR